MKIPSPQQFIRNAQRELREAINPRLYADRIIKEDAERKAEFEASLGGTVLALEADEYLRTVEAVGETQVANCVEVDLVPVDAN